MKDCAVPCTSSESYVDEGVPVPIFDGFYDDSNEKDHEEWSPPPTYDRKGKKVQLEWSDARSFIRSMVEEMDWRKLSVRDAHHLLLSMYIKGGGDPSNPMFSVSTVQRVVEEVRAEAVQTMQNQEFPDHPILHFDGVKVNLGSQNGGRRIEHLAVSVTGLGGEKKLEIFEIENGTGAYTS